MVAFPSRRSVVSSLLMILVAASISSADPVQWSENDHWYEEIGYANEDLHLTWPDAFAYAEASSWMGMQGYLATLTSTEEDAFVQDNVLSDPLCCRVWFGGYQDPPDSPPDQNWFWVTGESWDYTNWGVDQPDDGGVPGSEFYLAHDGTAWLDQVPEWQHPFVIEYGDVPTPTELTTWGRIRGLYR